MGNNEIWICKFGGSSLANAAQIKKVKELILADERRQIVVLSAPGKEHQEDTKITDLLLQCHALITEGKSFDSPFTMIRKRFLEIASILGVGSLLAKELDAIYERLPQEKSADYAASRGEYLNALLISEYFEAEFIDAKEMIRLTLDGGVDEQTYMLTTNRLAKRTGRVVIPGFYGLNAKGNIQTFSRGGSDITGAVIARAVQAAVYENWTDVSGIYLADPRIVPEVQPIKQITYREIHKLSCIGASVLHEDAIAPVREVGIPIHIKNTNDPSANGTIITEKRDVALQHIVGVSGKKGYQKFTVDGIQPSVYKAVQEFFAKKHIRYDVTLKSFDTATFYVSTPLDISLYEELCRIVGSKNCELSKPLVLIGIIGEGLLEEPRLPEQVRGALVHAGLVPTIITGILEMEMLCVLPQEDYALALQTVVKVVQNL